MKTLKKHTAKELRELMLEAQDDETSPERLIEIWEETTSPKVREKVVLNPMLPLEFVKKPKVMTLAAQAILDNPSVDLLLLFESSQVFPPNLVKILRVIMKVKNEGWSSIEFAKDIELTRSFPYTVKPLVQAAMREENSMSSKIEFINYACGSGGIVGTGNWRIEKALREDVFSGKRKRKRFVAQLSSELKDKISSIDVENKNPYDFLSRIHLICNITKNL